MQNKKISISHPTFDIEKYYLKNGFNIIAGIDEAGRGALAGPLVVGLVIYPKLIIQYPAPQIQNYVNDSKKLNHARRCEALDIIKEYSELTIAEVVSHQLIDNLNINKATEYGIKSLLRKISFPPDLIIMDGNFKFDLGIPVVSLVKGDTISTSVASASIVAKIRRDCILDEFDLVYPGYSFKKNKGYGTSEHRRAIERLGPSPIHRRSYRPLFDILSQE